ASQHIDNRNARYDLPKLCGHRASPNCPFLLVLSGRERRNAECSRRPPNQTTSCQLCPTACRPVCMPKRQRGTSVPAKRSFMPETLVMAVIASIEADSRLTLSQSVGRH